MIRLGVVGHGERISYVIKEGVRKIRPDLRVVGIVDPNPEYAKSFLEECDRKDAIFYESMTDMIKHAKLDALAVGTRCNLHTPYAVEASRYDIPLYLEKPVAINMQQAMELEKAFEKSKCQVVVSFPLRVSPLCCQVKELLDNNAVGRRDHILAVNYVPYGTVYWDSLYRDFDVTHGLFLQKATHDFDYIMFLMDSCIVRVSAMTTTGRIFGGSKPAKLRCSECAEANDCFESPQNRARNASGGQLKDHWCVFGQDCGTVESGLNEDSSSALLEFANGAHCVYTQVFYSRRDAAIRGATVSGYMGTVSFDWYKNEIRHVRHHKPFTDIIRADVSCSHFGGDIELARDFVDIINGRKARRATIWQGLQSAYACLAAKESAAVGTFVKVRQVAQC